jgi:hypothetical protein
VWPAPHDPSPPQFWYGAKVSGPQRSEAEHRLDKGTVCGDDPDPDEILLREVNA